MRFWIGVASREHVMIGVEGGFCQLGHGRAMPIRRVAPGDWIVYYSPRTSYPAGEPLRAFTAIGRVMPGEPYAADAGGNFVATRRDVLFISSCEAPIKPLLGSLSFTAGKRNWGQLLRRGLFQINERDFTIIAQAMGAEP
jgi:hypothetical protein